MARLAKRLADRRLTLTVTPAAREWLALTGFDPVYGARPLRRLVQSAIGDQLARALLSGEIADGDTVDGRPGSGVGRADSCAPGCPRSVSPGADSGVAPGSDGSSSSSRS